MIKVHHNHVYNQIHTQQTVDGSYSILASRPVAQDESAANATVKPSSRSTVNIDAVNT